MSTSQYKFKAGDILKHKRRSVARTSLLIHGPGKSSEHYTYSWSDDPENIRDYGEKGVIEEDFTRLTKLELILK